MNRTFIPSRPWSALSGNPPNVAPVTQSQIAATLAAFAGLDWNSAEPKADPAIRSVTK